MNQKKAKKIALRIWKIYFLFLLVINIVAICTFLFSSNTLSYIKGVRGAELEAQGLSTIIPLILSTFALCFVSFFNILSLSIYRLKQKPKGWGRLIYFMVLFLSGGYIVFFFYLLYGNK